MEGNRRKHCLAQWEETAPSMQPWIHCSDFWHAPLSSLAPLSWLNSTLLTEHLSLPHPGFFVSWGLGGVSEWFHESWQTPKWVSFWYIQCVHHTLWLELHNSVSHSCSSSAVGSQICILSRRHWWGALHTLVLIQHKYEWKTNKMQIQWRYKYKSVFSTGCIQWQGILGIDTAQMVLPLQFMGFWYVGTNLERLLWFCGVDWVKISLHLFRKFLHAKSAWC